MDLFEIEATVETILENLGKVADAIKPMLKEEFVREDAMLTAWNLIGGSRVGIRKGLEAFQSAIEHMKGGQG